MPLYPNKHLVWIHVITLTPRRRASRRKIKGVRLEINSPFLRPAFHCRGEERMGTTGHGGYTTLASWPSSPPPPGFQHLFLVYVEINVNFFAVNVYVNVRVTKKSSCRVFFLW